MLTIAMNSIALAVAQEAQTRGGLLLHGALAARPGLDGASGEMGVVLAGPGTVGKTTASSRLPPPWRSLCDDATLLVRDRSGDYWAHPVPTWSRFYRQGGVPPLGGSWDTQQAVPLRALFLLSQAAEDRVAPLNAAEATALLMESTGQITRVLGCRLEESARPAFYREQLANVRALVARIPVYRLDVCLTGTFWREVEATLAATRAAEGSPGAPAVPAPLGDLEDLLGSWMVYTGPSMNPTLVEPDLVEIQPYGDRPVRAGDVIAFRSPTNDIPVVHRVLSVTPEGMRTRGDNNPCDDAWPVRPGEILGRVSAVRRGKRHRTLAGGWRGLLDAAGVRASRHVRRPALLLPREVYRAVARTGLVRRLLPARLRPRVVVFTARNATYAKLVAGNRTVGRYDTFRKAWSISRPFNLLVDAERLPRFPPPKSLPAPGTRLPA